MGKLDWCGTLEPELSMEVEFRALLLERDQVLERDASYAAATAIEAYPT
jgi:hypothetical protein